VNVGHLEAIRQIVTDPIVRLNARARRINHDNANAVGNGSGYVIAPRIGILARL